MSKTVEEGKQQKAFGWAATDQSGTLHPFNFSRKENGDDDVTLKILYCGVCHSDLHILKNDWVFTSYPVVPGHEIVGVATKVGKNVTKFKVGDRVGALVGSCKTCECCQQDLENYFPQLIFTYNSHNPDGTKNYGGITVYSPMKYYGMTEAGKRLGITGLGGLGHVAVKIAKAFGLKVTVISSSAQKESEAINRLGADSFLVSSDPAKMKSAIGSMDYIIDTVYAAHPLLPLLTLLKVNGKLVTVGLPNKPLELPVFPLVSGRKLVGGSDFGGMKETQEMLDFCARNNIDADIELIRIDEINTAMERLAKSDANALPTSGFREVSLSQSNFELQRPQDKSPCQRYSFNNGVHRLWVNSTDKPHTPTSNTNPRAEISIRIALLALSYATNDSAFELSGVELGDNPSSIELCCKLCVLKLSVVQLEVEIQVSCIIPSPISSSVKLKLALELGNCLLTTSRPFAVKLNLCCLESNILRCEVEIGFETGKPLRREVKPQNGMISSVVELKSWMCGYDILRRGVEIVDGPFVVELSLDLNILHREVEIQLLYVAGGYDSLHREVKTVDDPFIVKFDFELDILRYEVEIYSRAN
ncbi:putative cinnamyl alcohol dehydrogenase 9 [Hibiscus syriacus]|uniref:Cinnamyl alcohol dehydrogenase 9 n=1 Tax=Hibiscus syriacus TaxID=106335 RepID=A0A6A2Y1V6_HIBSY|nr:putative cinnamyl alcohol dehydrogenase 9 [Hibiscus syriacus]